MATAMAAPQQQPTATASAGATNNADMKEFIDSGRTGRRNAVPDIKGDPNISTDASDISDKFRKLSSAAGVKSAEAAGSSVDRKKSKS